MSQHDPEPLGSLLRPSDRVRTVVGWALIVAAVCLAVGAGVAAASAYRDGLDRIQRDAAARTMVVGVLLDDATPVGSGPGRPVRVSYVDAVGRPHVGQVPMTGFLPVGTPVRVEVDGDGRVGVAPPTRGDAVMSAITVATGVTVLGGLVLALVWVGLRVLVASRNQAAWEREWRRIEPRWSGRRV